MGNSSIFTQAFGKNLLAPGSTMIQTTHDTRLDRMVKAEEVIGDNASRAFDLRQRINNNRRDPLTPFLCLL